jgi:hypothetical protein
MTKLGTNLANPTGRRNMMHMVMESMGLSIRNEQECAQSTSRTGRPTILPSYPLDDAIYMPNPKNRFLDEWQEI